ncbi:contractile injection system protein, VgrG/Pvc8 family, partial [Starkeya nomas]|uniref:contractile injection system protein, VgrG/Pvc8 family n=1 Tax=Starkeya nomas TaxID=2666134 RepID=UPI00190F9000
VKAGGTQHFDDMSLADILSDVARSAGLTLAIDPQLAEVRIPYSLRWEASPIDFASRLAAEHGGIVKPGGEKLSVVRRGAGTDASGADLPRIRVKRIGSGGWNIEGEPRPRFGEVGAAWQDPKTGRRQIAKQKAGQSGPVHNLIHPRATEAEAEAAAEARARELNTQTASGFFVTEFDPTFSAGAIVEASGFGEGVDGEWPSERISTSWEKGSPVLSTIDVTAKPDKAQGGE